MPPKVSRLAAAVEKERRQTAVSIHLIVLIIFEMTCQVSTTLTKANIFAYKIIGTGY